MSELAPMLRLDLMSLASLRRMMLVYLGFVIVYAFAWGPDMAVPLLVMGGLITSMNLFTIGESNRLTLLFDTLPVRRRTVVASHYLIALASLVLFMVVGLMVCLVVTWVRDEPADTLGASALAAIGMILLLLSAMLPAYFRWGVRVSGIVILAYALAGALAISATALLTTGRWGLDAVAGLLLDSGLAWLSWGPWLPLAIGTVMFAASYPISVRIFENQDH